MVLGPSANAVPMSNPRGYSDFFASGFRVVSHHVRRRSASKTSFNGSPTDQENAAELPQVAQPSTSRSQSRGRRPMSMIIPGTSSSTGKNRESRFSTGRRSSFVSFSSRLFDRMSFASSDKNSSSSSCISEDSHLPDIWITAGGPYTPSAPNGSNFVSGPDSIKSYSLDPFASSPESKSFFVDLSDSSPSDSPNKRDSFLSMTTNSSSSPALSFLHLPRRERSISIQTMPLPSRSRRSSLHYRPHSSEKSDFWILEEEPDVLTPTPEAEGYDMRDDAARIDWRQFHNDLLTVEV